MLICTRVTHERDALLACSTRHSEGDHVTGPPTWGAAEPSSSTSVATRRNEVDSEENRKVTWLSTCPLRRLFEGPSPPKPWVCCIGVKKREGASPSMEQETKVGRPNPNPNSISKSQCESERMVDIELDAARVLADFAQTARLESGGVGIRNGLKERSKKRIKNGAPPRVMEERSQDPKNKRMEHDCLIDDTRQDEKAIEEVTERRINVTDNSELCKSNVSCSTSHASYFGHRMKQNISEAEREARRIRRVLANRESARQTIRRRQALREELTKKVTDLLLDNENMKKEKELAMKEYLSLQDRNKQLKQQMAKTISCRVEVKAEITHMLEAPTSSSTELLRHKKPLFTPYIWPFWPFISSHSRTCHENGDPNTVSTSRSVFCVSPSMLFYPLPHQTSECHPSNSCTSTKQGADFAARAHSLQPGSHATYDLGRGFDGNTTSISLAAGAGIQEETNAGVNLQEMPSKTSIVKDETSEPVGTVLQLSLGITNSSSVARGEPELGDVEVEKTNDCLCPAVQGKPGVPSIQPHKKLVDPIAAAEARKRRTELTKLKHLLRRRVRMHD